MSARLRHLRRLVTLLEEERAALHDTDLARLDGLTPRKMQLLDQIAADTVAPASADEAREIEEVQSLARRNAGLIEAALAGLRDVQALLDRARQPAAHATYGRDGTRQDMGPTAGRLDGRA